MSYKGGESEGFSYAEGVKVKIAEQYKPPPVINLAFTYSQRLNLNKQVRDSLPEYSFSLEKDILERVKLLKATRSEMAKLREARDTRLRVVKEFLKNKLIEEKNKAEEEAKEAEEEAKKVNNTGTYLLNSNSRQLTLTTDITTTCQTYSNSYSSNSYSSTSNLLIPTHATITSNVLQPIPLSEQNYTSKQEEKSPFNISDFEADTSSPFDNMELQSINDKEELARVLRTDSYYNKPIERTSFASSPPVQFYSYQQQVNHPNPLGNQYNSLLGSQYSNSLNATYPQQMLSAATPIYNGTNHSYPLAQPSFNDPVFYQPYQLNKSHNFAFIPNNVPETCSLNKPSSKSEPDIFGAVESELNNINLEGSMKSHRSENNYKNPPVRQKSTDGVRTSGEKNIDCLEDPYFYLPKNLQELSRNVSSMGFPLSRVARTCKHLGNDHKKVVEHLLAMSELMDLGFSESSVSKALLECDNDRDRALDRLIS